MNGSRLLAILGLIVFGIVSRLLPHPPNFTSLTAIALCSTFYLGNRRLSFITVLSTVFLSDLVIGFHTTMPFVYLSFSLIILMGHALKDRISLRHTPVVCLATSLLFFLVNNLGVWLTGVLYPKTLHGLGLCYLAAIPFLTHQVLADLTYGIVLFGCLSLTRSQMWIWGHASNKARHL